MPLTAVVLFSGGLDSMLAVRILQEQGAAIEALNFQTLFTCCQNQAAAAADELGVTLTLMSAQDDYLDLVRRPKHGYGRGANPCVDCRAFMFGMAKKRMHDLGADLVASGEVLGQRPMSQKRADLAVIAREAGLEDRLLRPLSAKLLPPTALELSGQIDREKLYSFTGQGRKGQIALARQFGFRTIPSASNGCALTEPAFANKVHDLIQLNNDHASWDFELLKVGRHVRIDAQTKAVIGRRADENDWLEQHFARDWSTRTALLTPANFAGPTCLLVGNMDDRAIEFAGGLLLRYAKNCPAEPRAIVRGDCSERVISLSPSADAMAAIPL